jgi:hypothetical protein
MFQTSIDLANGLHCQTLGCEVTESDWPTLAFIIPVTWRPKGVYLELNASWLRYGCVAHGIAGRATPLVKPPLPAHRTCYAATAR